MLLANEEEDAFDEIIEKARVREQAGEGNL